MKLVSVIIPTYNGTDKLKRCIQSVIENTYPIVEIIVVDDNGNGSEASTRTESIVKSMSISYPHIKYIKHKFHKNGAAARNTGASIANGEYISFLDDDDYIVNSRIEKSVAALDAGADIVFTDVCIVRYKIDYRIHRTAIKLKYQDIIVNELAIGTGSNLFLRKEIYNKLGGFDETYHRFQDREFAIRACQIAQIKVIPEILIVKGKNRQNNVPDINKRLEIEKMFESKFHNEINILSQYEKKQYYLGNLHNHFEMYLLNNNIIKIHEIYQILKSENNIKASEKIAYFLIRHNISLKSKIVIAMKNIYLYCINSSNRIEIKKNRELWNFIKYYETNYMKTEV